jgi:hypothetical protein
MALTLVCFGTVSVTANEMFCGGSGGGYRIGVTSRQQGDDREGSDGLVFHFWLFQMVLFVVPGVDVSLCMLH